MEQDLDYICQDCIFLSVDDAMNDVCNFVEGKHISTYRFDKACKNFKLWEERV